MKNLLPFLLVVLCVGGCNRAGSDSNSTSNTAAANNSAKAPSKPVKQIDVPSLLGKTKDEVKKIVGSEPKAEMPEELEWRITDKYDLDVNFDKGKAYKVHYTMPSGLAAGTPEEMGGLIGVDLAGKKPDSDGGLAANFKAVSTPAGAAEVAVYKSGANYNAVLVEIPRK